MLVLLASLFGRPSVAVDVPSCDIVERETLDVTFAVGEHWASIMYHVFVGSVCCNDGLLGLLEERI